MPILNGSSPITKVFYGSTEISKVYYGSQLIYQKGGGAIPITDLSVGNSVFLKENGTLAEYIIVHIGSPGSGYTNADGVWVLRKGTTAAPALTIAAVRGWRGNAMDTACTSFYTNNLSAYDSLVLQPTIPTDYAQNNRPYAGTDSRKCFLLSYKEVGGYQVYGGHTPYPSSDLKLSYFTAAASGNAARIAYYNGSTAVNWYTRSNSWGWDDDRGTNVASIIVVNTVGFPGARIDNAQPAANYLRPALVISKSATVDPNTHELLI